MPPRCRICIVRSIEVRCAGLHSRVYASFLVRRAISNSERAPSRMPVALPRERPLEVDAARLLLILHQFAIEPTAATAALQCWPRRPIRRHFSPEYYLQKLDFLVRYPAYLAFELTELHRLGVPAAADKGAVQRSVQLVLRSREPELRTLPFRKFWRGAYEPIDHVEAWWYAKELVYVGIEPRGEAGSVGRPQKHYFLTVRGEEAAQALPAAVEHSRWYVERIRLIHRFFGALTPPQVKSLQYAHPSYRAAQIGEFIPDLAVEDISQNFRQVFGIELAWEGDDD
jgi:hypothetical protein